MTTAASALTGNWMGARLCYLATGFEMWRRFESGKWKKTEIFR